MIHKNIQQKSAVFENFGGMNAAAPFGEGSCVWLENFRVRNDGSLEKREGYRHIATLPAAVRAAYPYRDGGEEVLLLVAGSCLCRVRKSDGDMTFENTFVTAEGRALFFECDGVLYILDGGNLYRYEGGAHATLGDPYIPLMAEWSADKTPDEPPDVELNLMSVRGTYLYKANMSYVDGSFRKLCFGRPVIAVEHLYVGDEEYDASAFTYASDRTYIQMNEWTKSYGAPITVHVILSDEAPLLSATQAFSYETPDTEGLYLYGAQNGSVIYRAMPCTDSEKSQMRDRPAFPVFFPASGTYAFDEGRRITALLRMGKRLLAFSDRDISITKGDFDVAAPDFYTFCPLVGCTAKGSVFLLDDTNFLTVAGDGVYRVTPDFLLEEECYIKRLSEPVHGAFGDAFFTGATLCPMRREGEIWFFDPSRQGEVFVLRPDDGAWTVFGGIRADILLDFFGDVAFADGVFVGLFDENAKADYAAYGTIPIEGKLTTSYFDFGTPERDKRLSGFLAVADLDGGELEVRIADDGYLAEFTLPAGGAPTFSHLHETNLRSGRFRFASLRLIASGEARQRLWRAQIFT